MAHARFVSNTVRQSLQIGFEEMLRRTELLHKDLEVPRTESVDLARFHNRMF